MNLVEMMYHLENLEALDPDQVVSDLRLTTKQILDAFPMETERYIEREFG